MHRVVYAFLLVTALILGACNTKEMDKQGSSDVLYRHTRELKQNFEGVQLTMIYVVQGADDRVALQVSGKLVNGFSADVYYTPTFIVEDRDGTQYESSDVQEMLLAPAQELTFTEVIELPSAIYEANDYIRFFVPAAFTQSGSVSSGDALGDTVWWELPLK